MLYFAQSRELAGVSEEDIGVAAAPQTGHALLDTIMRAHPGLEPLRRAMVLARNEEYMDMDAQVTLAAGDVVALIPPLSGG